MPETLGRVGETAGNSSRDKSVVKWEVEDPSEFRPGLLNNMGKEEENFRIFDVSRYIIARWRKL